MARHAEYDIDEVLDKAMELFWKRGYEGVSMAELVEHTGLNRRTMYALFKDKNGLFKEALDRYYMKSGSKKLKILKENPGKKGIELFFRQFSFSEDFKGCLFSNSLNEKVFIKTDTYKIPTEYFKKIRLGLKTNLEQAKKDGDFHGDVNAMSLTLLTMIHGFHVHGKYNCSKEDSKIIIDNILSMIK